MRRFVLLAILTFLAAHSDVSAQSRSIFVSPTWLGERIADPELVLFQVGTKAEYDSMHIPGAQYLNVGDISLRTPERSLEMPPLEMLDSLLEIRGVSDNSTVVIYYGNDWVTPTARAYVTLDYLGLGDRTFILNGGLPAWTAAGNSVTSAAPKIRKGSLTPRVRENVLVETEWISSRLGDSTLFLIDARDPEFYNGVDPGSGVRAGHIPGAHSIPYSSVVDSAHRVNDVPSLRRIFAESGVREGAEVVTYCHVGQQASLMYVAAKELGYTPHLYDGSFQAWSKDESLPVSRPMKQWLPKRVSTADLEALIKRDSLVLIDLRSDLPSYLKGHLPGALYLHLESLRATNNGTPTDLLTPEAYASLFGQLGIRFDQPVVIYASAEGSHFMATYLAWILLGFGHHDIFLLEGGYEKWIKEGRTVTRSYPDTKPSNFPSSGSTFQRARLPQVRWIVDQKMGILVDARSPAQYEGSEGPQMRLGHIPGAINHFWKTDLVPTDSGTVWKNLEDLRSSYERQGITPDKRIVVYCNSGAEASHVYFSLYCLLQYPNVRVYVPSYTEWAELEDLPVETGR